MDVRDFAFWTQEASTRVLMKRMEAYAASLLPHQEKRTIHARLNDVRWRIFELENEEDIESIEKAANERLRELKKKKTKTGGKILWR